MSVRGVSGVKGSAPVLFKTRFPAGELPPRGKENPRHKAEEHYYAALDLMADGKLEEAVVAYRESLATDPVFTEAMHRLARALQDLQRYDEAIAVAEKITEVHPDDALDTPTQ